MATGFRATVGLLCVSEWWPDCVSAGAALARGRFAIWRPPSLYAGHPWRNFGEISRVCTGFRQFRFRRSPAYSVWETSHNNIQVNENPALGKNIESSTGVPKMAEK